MNNKLKKNLLVLWLISPIVCLFYTLRFIRDKQAFPYYVLFSFFFGLSFVIDQRVVEGADSARYAKALIDLHNSPISFKQMLSNIYSEDTNKTDLYQPILTWLVSKITGNPKWLFSIFGLIFGWFWFNNIQILAQYTHKKIRGVFLILFLLFALLIPIWYISGVRMWTAAQIYIFGILTIYLKKNYYRGFTFCILSVFVHFSFILPLITLIIYFFLPKNTLFFFILYLASFAIKEIDIHVLQEYYNYLPAFLQSRKSYINDSAYATFIETQFSNSRLSFHVVLANYIEKYFSFISILFLFFETRYRSQTTILKFIGLFNLTLFMSSIVNIINYLPSGGRFLAISDYMLLATIIIFYNTSGINYYKRFLKIYTPLLLFLLLFKIRVGFDYIGILTIIGNPLLACFFNDIVPLIDFIKKLI